MALRLRARHVVLAQRSSHRARSVITSTTSCAVATIRLTLMSAVLHVRKYRAIVQSCMFCNSKYKIVHVCGSENTTYANECCATCVLESYNRACSVITSTTLCAVATTRLTLMSAVLRVRYYSTYKLIRSHDHMQVDSGLLTL